MSAGIICYVHVSYIVFLYIFVSCSYATASLFRCPVLYSLGHNPPLYKYILKRVPIWQAVDIHRLHWARGAARSPIIAICKLLL